MGEGGWWRSFGEGYRFFPQSLRYSSFHAKNGRAGCTLHLFTADDRPLCGYATRYLGSWTRRTEYIDFCCICSRCACGVVHDSPKGDLRGT